MLLSEIAQHLGGVLKGQDRDISGVSTLEEAEKSDITFLANPKYKDKVGDTSAGAIIVGEELDIPLAQIIVDNPYLRFAGAVNLLYPEKQHAQGISEQAFVHPDARVDEDACIYPHVYIGQNARVTKDCVIYPGCFIGDNATIGEATTLHPNVVIYDGCILGSHCIIHAGVVIGSDGFGFVWDGEKHFKIPQKGIVVIGDHVEIGSNCTIDRAALTSTRIGSDVKMDNLVQIGHNVTIGDHTIIVAQSGVAGSAKIGRSVVLAAQSGVAGHITVGDGCTAAGRAGVASDLAPGKIVSGFPAMDHRQWLRAQKVYKDLPNLLKRVRDLERRLDALDTD
jgi:UDP-3-O-[3-hydroxymyristoyl] glucosamine N-acyltransferase